MFAFFVLSSSPGVDIKQFGIGLAAGIIFDATVIRALLVPALMRLLGELELVAAAGRGCSSCRAPRLRAGRRSTQPDIARLGREVSPR